MDYRYFSNYAGRSDVDENLTSELEFAGIEVVNLSRYGLANPYTSEVKSSIIGDIHLSRWTFYRAWRYWVAEGPGIPPEIAMELWERNNTARVGAHAASPSPLEWYNGFGVGLYHIDTFEGLRDLATTIKSIRKRSD